MCLIYHQHHNNKTILHLYYQSSSSSSSNIDNAFEIYHLPSWLGSIRPFPLLLKSFSYIMTSLMILSCLTWQNEDMTNLIAQTNSHKYSGMTMKIVCRSNEWFRGSINNLKFKIQSMIWMKKKKSKRDKVREIFIWCKTIMSTLIIINWYKWCVPGRVCTQSTFARLTPPVKAITKTNPA